LGGKVIRRFIDGDEGRRRLEEALRDQRVVAHDADIAKAIADCSEVKSYAPGEVILRQDEADTDVFLILAGTVSVEIGGRQVAVRKANETVGEMGMIEVSARRSATARASSETIVARVTESDFAPIANANPGMWRRLAIDLGRRLRERGELVRPVNEKPVVFVGSTTERLTVARALQTACQYDPWVTRLWTDGVFTAGRTPIEALAAQVKTLDFGLMVVTADDIVEARGVKSPTPRDNVIFELGLLIGELGRDRTFMVRLRDEKDLKLPSDVVGVKPLEITPGSEADLASRVGPAIDEFRKIVARLGPR
jgi:CRP/FNR family cyclic AMP-dependent transcriptional regulator